MNLKTSAPNRCHWTFFLPLILTGLLASAFIFLSIQPAFAGDIQTYYGPEDHLQSHMISLYQNAEKSIYIACFNMTSKPITRMLIRARKKGIDVRIITDHGELENEHTRKAIHSLRQAGIPIKVNRHEGLMHIKQVIIDDQINTSGSFNQTWSANTLNDERLDVIIDSSNTRKAREKFLSMWNDHVRFVDFKD
ncbi:MAG: phospholipase D family protein [Nitrospirae bacterium]|nr:phospholipase D family protein [Nitrospirota bacterium]MBI3352927.1 phospholipase D family protein [Nitrospirota bacterium]